VSSDQTHPDEKAKAKQEAFLQKDYELKITYLTDQFARMWNRFNYFVAIEAALVGGKFLIPNEVLSRALAIVGVLISALWYVMGAEIGISCACIGIRWKKRLRQPSRRSGQMRKLRTLTVTLAR
jgi:hypothetical protein